MFASGRFQADGYYTADALKKVMCRGSEKTASSGCNKSSAKADELNEKTELKDTLQSISNCSIEHSAVYNLQD